VRIDDMQELKDILSNIETDDSYHVLQILKENPYGRTEKVTHESETYIRKYVSHERIDAKSEYRLLSGLNHSFLPQVHDYYELSGQSVLIEEFVDGIKLSDLVHTSGRLIPEKTVDISIKLCEICSYLHKQKPYPIIHRDIKPDNIICTIDGQIKLLDFGAAREYKDVNEKDTVYVGTMGYAPPEQFGFGQTDGRADIYGIGMTMIHMLTGKAPERGRKTRLSNTGIPVDLQSIIRKATQFDPAKRHADISELLSDLSNLVPDHSGRPDVSKIKSFLLRPSDRIYPRHCTWPTAIKILFMPVHVMLLLAFAAIISRDLFTSTGFGRTDDLLQLVNDFGIFLFAIFPPYLLGFNLFNINERIRFFHRRRLIKKILILLILLIIGGLLLTYFNGFHSEAYNAAQNLAGS